MQLPDLESDAAAFVREALAELGVSVQPLVNLREVLPTPSTMVDLSFLADGLTAARSVCFVEVEDRGSSTGWLIAPDLVVMPAHLMLSRWRSPLPGISDIDPKSIRVLFEDDGPDRPRTNIAVSAIVSLDYSTDLMMVRLAFPMADRRPLQLAVERVESGPVVTIHHPVYFGRGRKMISYVGGRLISNDGHQAYYVLATTGGSAGAPIFDQRWKVIATHRAWQMLMDTDGESFTAKRGTSMEALVEHVRRAPSDRALWRRIVAAQDELRMVDPDLFALENDARMPVVVNLLDESTAIPDVPGLSVSMRRGALVTGIANGAAVRTLAAMQGVVSVGASRDTVTMECRRSLPFVGIPLSREGIAESGTNAIVAIIDDGIDPFHHAFRDAAGASRIDSYWDQREPATGIKKPTHTAQPQGWHALRGLGL